MIVLYILLGIIAFIVIVLHFSVCAYVKADKSGVDVKVKYLFFTLYPRSEKPKKTKKKKKQKNKTHKAHKSPPENISENSDEEYTEPAPKEIPIEELMKIEPEEIESENSPELTQSLESIPQTETEVIQVEEDIKPEDTHKPQEEKKTQSIQGSVENENNEKSEENDEDHNSGSVKDRLNDLKDKYHKVKPYIPMGWKYFKKLLKAIRITHVDFQVTLGKEDAYEAAVFYGKMQGVIFGLLGVISGIFTVSVDKADVDCVFDEKVFDAKGETVIKIRPSTLIAICVCVGVNFLKIWLPKYFESRKKPKYKVRNNAEKKAA